MVKPRPYQVEAKEKVFKEWEQKSSTLVVQPVGTGKTILFAMVIADVHPKRAMVVAERRELIYQARDKITKVTGLECGIEMADSFVNCSLFGDIPVVVSTIQTQCSAWGDRRRMARFNPQDFGVLVIDECHHSTAKSYRDLINFYKTQNPGIKVLGVTATPDRADEQALNQVFESVAFNYEIQDAIADGWLVNIQQQFVHINGLDFSHVRTTCGDLNGADLALVMEAESNMQGVAAASLNFIGNKRALVFTASVKQAEMIANIFNRHRAGMAEWVCGETNQDWRAELLRRFQAGDVQVMCNCNCLSEGYDDPGVEVVVQARPTKSRSLYAQQIGRCARPLPGVVDGPETPEQRKDAIAASRKPHCLVIDFVGNSGRHKLITAGDILGGRVSPEAVQRVKVRATKSGAAYDVGKALEEEERLIRLEAEARRKAEEARKAKLVAKVKFSAKEVNPFSVFDMQPPREVPKDKGKQLSEKQKAMLQRQGFNPDTMNYTTGRKLMDTLFDRWKRKLATVKQCQLLKRYGYKVDGLTMTDATKLIDALAANNWRKPPEQPKTKDDNVPF